MGPAWGQSGADRSGPHVGPINFDIWDERDAALLCATFQNDCTPETDVMDKRVFARFEFKIRMHMYILLCKENCVLHTKTEKV